MSRRVTSRVVGERQTPILAYLIAPTCKTATPNVLNPCLCSHTCMLCYYLVLGRKIFLWVPMLNVDRPVASRYCCARGGSALITLLFTSSVVQVSLTRGQKGHVRGVTSSQLTKSRGQTEGQSYFKMFLSLSLSQFIRSPPAASYSPSL